MTHKKLAKSLKNYISLKSLKVGFISSFIDTRCLSSLARRAVA
ncbi:hypothetical protein NEOC95_002230 [Neochlamydia sp. AcF95]|nr:hypothetical protein [Neochlamydia sp. AcF95]